MTLTANSYLSNSAASFDTPPRVNVLQSVNAFLDSFGLKPFKLTLTSFQDVETKKYLSDKQLDSIPPTARFIKFSTYKHISREKVNDYIHKIVNDKHISATLT